MLHQDLGKRLLTKFVSNVSQSWERFGSSRQADSVDRPCTPESIHTTHHDTPDCLHTRVQEPVTACFPTEERERQKARLKKLKAAGKTPQKKRIHVEDHFDDCGADLTGLAPYLGHDTHPTMFSLQPEAINFTHGLDMFWLLGSSVSADLYPQCQHTYIAANMHDVLHVLRSLDSKVDLVEVCGGAARTSTICIRKHLKVGKNFDLVTQCDLNDQHQQELILQYFRDHKPLVAVLSPRCSTFAAHSDLTYSIDPASWKENSAPHENFCGQLALQQDQESRFFILEQPAGSWLYEEYPWNIVCRLPSVTGVTIHQCMAGKKGPNGLPLKMPTDFLANHHFLLQELQSFQCDHSHVHDAFDVHAFQLWPWKLARSVANGIALLKQHVSNSDPPQYTYPAVGIGTDSLVPGHPVDEDAWRRCPGCRGRQSRHDERHNRIRGECKWPDTEAITWSCPGCLKHRPYGHSSHLLNETCKHAVLQHRLGVPRQGRHPRPPAKPATTAETIDLQPQLADGADLCADDEQQLSEPIHEAQEDWAPVLPPPEIERLSQCRGWHTTCSGDPVFIHDNVPEYVTPMLAKKFGNCPENVELCSYRATWVQIGSQWYNPELSVDWTISRPKGFLRGIANPSITIFHKLQQGNIEPYKPLRSEEFSDPQQPIARTRRTFQDAGAGTEAPGDWTRFDVSRSLRALQVGSLQVKQRELRKLHLRWWHASKKAMKRVLSAAGLSAQILALIPDVVNTCRECRAWSRPANETIPTLRNTTAFNEHVEADLMYFKEHIIFHFICCATRWHAAACVKDRSESELFRALNQTWLSIHGPMQELICDGEMGLMNEGAQARLQRSGIKPKVRAPGQHARYIERRGAILRMTLHCCESQLDREGVRADFEALLAEAVFAGNALVHVGGVTPYQCVYGRAPAMLPPLPEETLVTNMTEHEADKTRQHIRCAALESMIQATALARTSWAARSKAIAATEMQYAPGDMIDYHRPPSSKDTSGWHGPVRVLTYQPEDGIVVVDIRGKRRPCRLQDVRHTLFAHCSFQVFVSMPAQEAISKVRLFADHLPPQKFVTIGIFSESSEGVKSTPATRQHPDILKALDFLIEGVWSFDECFAARIGRECASLPKMSKCSHSTLIYWTSHHIHEPIVFMAASAQVSLKCVIGDDWRLTSFVQLLHSHDGFAVLSDSIDMTSQIHEEDSSGQHVITDNISERLSTEPEAEDETDTNQQFAAFVHDHFAVPDSEEELSHIKDLWYLHQDSIAEPINISNEDPFSNLFFAEPEDPWYECNAVLNPKPAVSPAKDESYLTELWMSDAMRNCFADSSGLKDDETLAIRIYHATSKVEVVKRASDILTPEELVRHRAEVEQAILNELKIWNDFGCFRLAPRAGATNIIDSRFVSKWKVKDPARPYESRSIRMRMTLRGFKEWRADLLEAHAATASRLSQRLLISEAACHPNWSFLSVDINKAFLQGATYRELAAATGEPERKVHFTLPPGAAAFLRRLPGFEEYDERQHVLQCVKPGTGCKDAPRAFSLKLAKVTRHVEIGLQPLSSDPECEVKHRDGKLVLMIAKHVDDIKITGEEAEVQRLIAAIEHVSGKMDRNDTDFTCVGIHHVRSRDGTIILDQNEYISAMKPIVHPDLVGKPADEACTETITRLYWSLLGAVAYTLLTQHWIAVYVISLQRHTHAPTYSHVRKLNSVLKVLQRRKATITFPGMTCCKQILAFSDASFCKESDTKGYGMRGSAFLRTGTNSQGDHVCHLIEAQSQSLKLVTRSTFSAETLAAVGTTDSLIPLMFALEEIHKGPMSADTFRACREFSNFAFHSVIIIDSMNLFHHWKDDSKRLPSEKSLFPHIWWLRDATRCAPKELRWADTRDMLADGLTKGTISRDLLDLAMQGFFKFCHAFISHQFKPQPFS